MEAGHQKQQAILRSLSVSVSPDPYIHFSREGRGDWNGVNKYAYMRKSLLNLNRVLGRLLLCSIDPHGEAEHTIHRE